jgi:hypothetical protein
MSARDRCRRSFASKARLARSVAATRHHQMTGAIDAADEFLAALSKPLQAAGPLAQELAQVSLEEEAIRYVAKGSEG